MFGYKLDDLEKLSNCIIFAVALFARRLAKGERGYLTIRKSDYCRFPHFLYVRIDPKGNIRFVSFVPDEHVICDFPPPLFKGHVQWGDPKPKHNRKSDDVSNGSCPHCGEYVESDANPTSTKPNHC